MNYTGNGRSNYINFTDVRKLKEICGFYSLFVNQNREGKTCILAANDDGDWATSRYCNDLDEFERMVALGLCTLDEADQEDIQLPDFEDILLQFIPDGEVFVWEHVGSEGNRYFNGYSFAMNNKGETIRINISDLYKQIPESWGTVTNASY